jgi:hypothetical protein
LQRTEACANKDRPSEVDMLEIANTTLLALHIAAGFVALGASLVAAFVKVLRMPHRTHSAAGRVFVWAMLGIFVTAVPMALLGGSLLLLLVAVLSGYLALAGWREAVRHRGGGAWIDRLAAIAMVVAGITMVGWGALALVNGQAGGLVLVAFGAIGLSMSASDLRRLGRPAERATRLVNHMSRMMGATIAVVTAFLVVNVRFDPGWVVWLAPTAVLTPMIFAWARAIRVGRLG